MQITNELQNTQTDSLVHGSKFTNESSTTYINHFIYCTFTWVAACPIQECTAIDHLGFLSATALGTDQQVKAQNHSNSYLFPVNNVECCLWNHCSSSPLSSRVAGTYLSLCRYTFLVLEGTVTLTPPTLTNAKQRDSKCQVSRRGWRTKQFSLSCVRKWFIITLLHFYYKMYFMRWLTMKARCVVSCRGVRFVQFLENWIFSMNDLLMNRTERVVCESNSIQRTRFPANRTGSLKNQFYQI